MKRRLWIFLATSALAVAVGAGASIPAGYTWFQSESAVYREGRAALDRSDWDDAIRAFERASSEDDPADGALYWLAYAQNKNSDAEDAMATLDRLEARFPASAWLDDARALRQEIGGGRPTGATGSDDEDLKLMALNGLMHSDDASAIPVLEEFLKGNHSDRLKSRALFVLAQSDADEAQQVVAGVARDGSNEELQRKAIQYLGVHESSTNTALLEQLYGSLESASAKRAVLHAFMISDQQERLLEVARSESDPELRGQAVHYLGTMEAEEELWSLYQAEASVEVRKKILHAFFVGDVFSRLLQIAQNQSENEEIRLAAIHWLGVSEHTDALWDLYQQESSEEIKKRILHGFFLSSDVERLAAVARDATESVELRRAAVHDLGISDEEGSRPILLALYGDESDPAIRERVLHGLFIQEAATDLIELYRSESDPELKKKAFHWLSMIDSEETKQFMLEVLRQ